MELIPALTVFVATFAADVAWAIYIIKVKNAEPLKASVWATILYGASAWATIAFTRDPTMLIPALAGAFAGTFVPVWWSRRWAS